jgi:hypothetical protein
VLDVLDDVHARQGRQEQGGRGHPDGHANQEQGGRGHRDGHADHADKDLTIHKPPPSGAASGHGSGTVARLLEPA